MVQNAKGGRGMKGRGEAHDNPMMASKQTKQTNTSLINI
jgi:hypothetical protein